MDGGKAGTDVREQRGAWTRTDAIAFDSRHRFMSTLHHDHEGHPGIYVKGATERILDMCSAQRTASGDEASMQREYWRAKADAIAGEGQRVLALAARSVAPQHTVLEHADVEATLVLIGKLEPALARLGELPETLGKPQHLLADTGYFSKDNVRSCEEAGSRQ